MSEHDPDKNPVLDEIQSNVDVMASYWLDMAEAAIIDQRIAPSCEAAAMQGFMQAAAIAYAAERQVDAAIKIADAINGNTATTAKVLARLDALIGPRFKGEPSRFVEPGEGAQL